MRTVSADVEKVLGAGHRSVHQRVLVKDSGGTFRDLTTYPGINLVERVRWGDHVDENGQTAEVELKREQCDVSLAPLMQASPLNRGFDPAASYAALLALRRELKIEWALMPLGMTPAAGDWQLGFHGYVDTIDWGPPSITVQCRDLSAKVQDTWIERERVYAFAQGAGATKGCFTFEENRAYSLNELVVPTDAKKNGKYFKVTTAGTSSGEPSSWPTTGAVASGTATFTKEGDTSLSTGTAVETVIQQILDDNLGAGVVTLNTPVSPGFNIKAYVQKTGSVWQAIRDLVDLFGWDLRYVYSAGGFLLALEQPDRVIAAPMRTFSALDYAEIQQLNLDIAPIRNRVRVTFNDSQDKDAGGNPKRKSVTVEDANSQTKYGVRFMEVAEEKASQIDTSSEATTFANAMLFDLKEPTAEQAASMWFFPFCELADYYRFSPNGRHYSTDLDVAVTAYSHELTPESHRTTLTVRGKPSAGQKRWLEVEAGPGVAPGSRSQLYAFLGGLTVTATPTVGGARIEAGQDDSKGSLRDLIELHLSGSASFTPSASTLKAAGRQRTYEVADLNPGETYYGQLVPVGRSNRQIVRGLPSTEFSFVAGRARPIHLDPETVPGPLPPNGSFEGRFRGAGSPPDLWAQVTGTWATDSDWISSDQKDGLYAVHHKNTSVAAKVRSDYFPVRAGWLYALEAYVKKVGDPTAGQNAVVDVEWYTSAKGSISTSTLTTDLSTIGTGWTRVLANYAAPSTAAYARVAVSKGSAATFAFYVDAISLVGSEPWIAPSLSNNWANYGGAFDPAGYYRAPDGRVFVRGLVACTTGTPINTVILTLPLGYRPANEPTYLQRSYWSGPAAEVATAVNIRANGDVVPVTVLGNPTPGTCTFLSLHQTFRAA